MNNDCQCLYHSVGVAGFEPTTPCSQSRSICLANTCITIIYIGLRCLLHGICTVLLARNLRFLADSARKAVIVSFLSRQELRSVIEGISIANFARSIAVSLSLVQGNSDYFPAASVQSPAIATGMESFGVFPRADIYGYCFSFILFVCLLSRVYGGAAQCE